MFMEHDIFAPSLSSDCLRNIFDGDLCSCYHFIRPTSVWRCFVKHEPSSCVTSAGRHGLWQGSFGSILDSHAHRIVLAIECCSKFHPLPVYASKGLQHTNIVNMLVDWFLTCGARLLRSGCSVPPSFAVCVTWCRLGSRNDADTAVPILPRPPWLAQG